MIPLSSPVNLKISAQTEANFSTVTASSGEVK